MKELTQQSNQPKYLASDKFKIPETDFKPERNEFVHAKLLKCWNNNIYNKLLI